MRLALLFRTFTLLLSLFLLSFSSSAFCVYDWTQDSRCQFSFQFPEGSSSTTNDSSPNNRDGSLTNSPTWDTDVPAVSGLTYSISMSRSSQQTIDVSVADSNFVSMAMWVWLNDASESSFFSWDNGNDRISAGWRTDDNLYFAKAGIAYHCNWATAARTSFYGVWEHFFFVYNTDASLCKLYMGGTLISLNSTTSQTISAGSTLHINAEGSNFSTQKVADIGLFNGTVPSASDVLDMKNNGLKQSGGGGAINFLRPAIGAGIGLGIGVGLR